MNLKYHAFFFLIQPPLPPKGSYYALTHKLFNPSFVAQFQSLATVSCTSLPPSPLSLSRPTGRLLTFHPQVKYDETMIRLEMATAACVELFTKAEARREELVTRDFVAWQRAQHAHLPRLLASFQGGDLDPAMVEVMPHRPEGNKEVDARRARDMLTNQIQQGQSLPPVSAPSLEGSQRGLRPIRICTPPP